MDVTRIVSSIDAEIARLQEARNLLSGHGTSTRSNAARKKAVGKRVMSAEAKKKIGDAQRKRWAAWKKAAK